ncbi:protein DOG1-like 4 [Rhodamnia argentea]|uniref:Protein DOG1-like 4 n=1 Tax=Rhodamnia argentea TaxID=178133 RepID=A0A8B8QL73_9MYRT|nr:protein DOG1-like 4 [Rhodamnia argentea]
MRTQEGEKFTDYFEKWVCRLEEYSQQLHSASREASITEQELRALVSKLTAHHKEYYTTKWAAAAVGGGGDVFAFFSPPWSTLLENAYSWLTGWKPSAAFRVVEALRARGAAMAEDQMKRIEQLRARIRLEEERVEREMERQQVAVADRRMVELARLAGRRGEASAAAAATADKVDGLVDAAVKGLASGLERIMKAADCVRLKTLKGLLDELSPSQGVEFLAAMSTLQVQVRRWGKKRQSQAEHKSSEAH